MQIGRDFVSDGRLNRLEQVFDLASDAASHNLTVRALETILATGLASFIVAPAGLGAVFIIEFVTFELSILALLMSLLPNPSGRPSSRPVPAHGMEALAIRR